MRAPRPEWVTEGRHDCVTAVVGSGGSGGGVWRHECHMRRLVAAIVAVVQRCAAQPPDVYQYVQRSGGDSAAQELYDVFHCDDGTTLVAGSTDTLSWLAEACIASDGDTACELTAADPASGVTGSCEVSAGDGSCTYAPAVPSTELEIASGSIDNSASSASRIGFVLALAPDDDMTPQHVSYFPAGTVDSVSRIRASSEPGETTQVIYISGSVVTASGSGYFIGKLNRNFVRGAATQLLWAVTVQAAGTLAVQQPWDVGADGTVALAATVTDGSATWSELQRLGVDGEPQVVEGWREHYDAAGELLHVTPASAAPTAAVRSVVVLDSSAARCGLRSWTSSEFNAFTSDGNRGARRGVWPNDVLMSLPCDTTDPSTGIGEFGYTGLRYDTSGSTAVTTVVVDRRDGSMYVGLQAPATAGTVPAIVAWSRDGQLIGWSRMMPETSAATAPVLEVADIAVDYANWRHVVVLGRGRRTGSTPRYFWSDPSGSGFQNSLADEVASQSEVWSSWIGKYDLTDRMTLVSATFVAELAAEAAVVDNGFEDLGGNLAGFADPNQLPATGMLLGDTSCHQLNIDSEGLIYVACTGIHTLTTLDAHHSMWDVAGLGDTTGTASRNAFVRVYASDLSDVSFSSLVTGEFDTAGVGGDNVELAAVSPFVGGLIVVATHSAAQQLNPIPVTNITWGGSSPQPGASSGVIGRFIREGLHGWPIITRFDCPAGRESQLEGMEYGCSICVAGRYAAQVNSPECLACSLGTYSSATEATSSETCIPCPRGYAGATEAASDVSQCVECVAGRTSSAATGLCEDCAVGTYAPEDASDACTNCPRGKYSTVVASSSSSDCTACEAGRYGPDPGAGSLDDCPVCPTGTWSDTLGATVCYDCAAGKASVATQATLESTCTDCEGGSISAAGADVCNPCPSGTYSSNSVSCALCPTGTWSANPGQSSGLSCHECPPGSYSSAGSTAVEACHSCDESERSQVAWGGCFECDGDSLPSFTASAEAIPFSSLKFGTFPSHAAGNLAPFWTGDGEFDGSMGAVSAGSLYLQAGESATGVLQFSHTNQVPFVVGGLFAAENFASGFETPPTMTVTAHFSDDRPSEQLVQFELEPMAGLQPAGDGEFSDEITVGYTSFEEPLISDTVHFVDVQGQDSDHELHAAAPACTGAPAQFLPSGSCIGTADTGLDCAARFADMPGSSESDCTGGDGAGCTYWIDCAARFSHQTGTTAEACTGGEGAGCTYTVHNPVSYSRCSVAPGAELGFRSFYVNRFNAEAGAEAAHSVGVVGDSSTTQVGRLTTPYGSQYFEIDDVNGFVYATLDTVPVSGLTSAWVQLWVHVNAAAWEVDDFVKVWAEAEAGGAGDVTIIDTEGTDWAGDLIEDRWTEIRGSLAGMKTATISFGGAARRGSRADNSEVRALAFDFIRVLGSSPDLDQLDQRATWPLATVCPQPSLWLGGQRSGSVVTPPHGATSIAVTITATTSGHLDDVYATVDPRIACWCDAGYAWEQEYSESSGDCLYCSAGSFCTMGLRQTCPDPLISRGGQSECEECPVGFTCIDGEKSTCQGLEYLDDNGNCQPCPAGSACVNARRTVCVAGSWSDGTLNQCALCTPGQYQSAVGATGCLNCDAGKTSTVGNSGCFSCGAGETSEEGEACVSCPVGRYSEVGTNTCEECPVGKFNGPGVDGLRAVAACEDCPLGQTSNSDFSGCE